MFILYTVAPLLYLMIFAFAAEQQGTIDIRVPSYVTRHGEAVAEASEERKQDAQVKSLRGCQWDYD
jgi:hypothetical protein